MTAFSAYVPVTSLAEVRTLLDEQGFGPENFSVPLRAGTEGATHAGLHAWGPPEFRQALADLAHLGVEVHDNEQTTGEGEEQVTVRRNPTESFGAMVSKAALDHSDPTTWLDVPVMRGDTKDGKESQQDYNVYPPTVNGPWKPTP